MIDATKLLILTIVFLVISITIGNPANDKADEHNKIYGTSNQEISQ